VTIQVGAALRDQGGAHALSGGQPVARTQVPRCDGAARPQLGHPRAWVRCLLVPIQPDQGVRLSIGRPPGRETTTFGRRRQDSRLCPAAPAADHTAGVGCCCRIGLTPMNGMHAHHRFERFTAELSLVGWAASLLVAVLTLSH
jgi:hypothetical protein